MTMLVAWVALPVVLGLLCLGCGLAVETLSGARLGLPLLVLSGFAVFSIVAQFAVLTASTAVLAAPAVVAVAIVGFAFGLARRRPDPWPVLAAAGAYAAYAAPVAASGKATFAGYIKLDDTATYLAMVDRIMAHGRSLAGLAPSTYEATLATSLAYGYPLGSLVPLGVAHELLRTDSAWLWQPYLAFIGCLVAFALYALARPFIASAPLAAAVAFVAAQPALLYGYSLWGGIKELSAAALVPAAAAAVAVALRAPSRRAAIPLAVICAALVGVLSLGGAIWFVPLLVGALVLLLLQHRLVEAGWRAGYFVVALLIGMVPPIVAAIEWLPRSKGFTSGSEFGNLRGPLRWLQVFGIWPVGDFRSSPHDLAPTYVLIAVVAAAALATLVWAILTERWELTLYVVTVALGAAAIVLTASPWVGAKAYATAAPVAVFLALAGAAVLAVRGRSLEASAVAIVLAAAVVGGIAWSNVLAYRAVWLAPRDRLAELERIGGLYAGQGPALMTEFDPYGARHFLRRLDAEGASELRRRFVNLQSGQPLEPQGYADIDRIRLPDLLVYRTLVLRRSPVESRPPSVYRLVWSGRWYQVWQRPDPAPSTIVAHLPLGTEQQPGAVPSCATVVGLASRAGVTRLVAPVRPPVASISLVSLPHPPGWQPYGDALFARSDGSVRAPVRILGKASYGLWVGGSFLGRVGLDVDRRDAGEMRHELEWSGQYVHVGSERIGPGTHTVAIRYRDGGIRPGSAGVAPFPLGPLVVESEAPVRVLRVPVAAARSLCGQRLDWLEGVRS